MVGVVEGDPGHNEAIEFSGRDVSLPHTDGMGTDWTTDKIKDAQSGECPDEVLSDSLS